MHIFWTMIFSKTFILEFLILFWVFAGFSFFLFFLSFFFFNRDVGNVASLPDKVQEGKLRNSETTRGTVTH